jgi:hypothetical protein
MKTSELTGAALDWAVAKCEEACIGDGYYTGIVLRDGEVKYTPSSDWSQGGPIIEREGLTLTHQDIWVAQTDDDLFAYGPTPLMAAMRCYVASKLGDTVEVPPELL